MNYFILAWMICNVRKGVPGRAGQTALICNINYLLHLLFITGDWDIYEGTVSSMKRFSGSAERYRILLGCARYPTFAKFSGLYSTIYPNHRACIFIRL